MGLSTALVLLLLAADGTADAGVDGGVEAALPWDGGAYVEAPVDLDTPDDGDTPEASEAETAAAGAAAGDGGLLYSTDLSDAELERRFLKDLPALGSVSVGFAEAGRVLNAVQLQRGDGWTVVSPEAAWGTQETIDALGAVARAVRERCPTAAPLRVNHIGKKEGGYLRPHQSHQSGRDVDLGFFYKAGIEPGAAKGNRAPLMDLAANWALLKAVATQTDVQVVLVDRRIQKVLYDYALAQGEDRAFLDGLFKAGREALVQHARRHRDHFHVRFFAPRSQELGRRLQPLLARRPEENLISHRVRSGDTLGRIAAQYGSTVKLIQKANGMSGTFLSLGRTLNVPLRGPCTKCPLPPPLVLPPRHLPPEVARAEGTPAGPSAAGPAAGAQ